MTRNEIVEKWCAALRSGKYKQCTSRLKVDTAYCCLGVLGEVVCGLPIGDAYPLFYLTMDDWLSLGFPAYCTNELGEVRDTQKFLAEMNDEEGKSFAEIADWIEEHLKEPTNAAG